MSTTYTPPPAPQKLPTCPSYCDGRHGDGSFEEEIETGRRFRMHSGGGWPSVPRDARHYVAEVCVFTEEETSGELTPSKVSVNARDLELTPDQAREYARYIIEAAITAEREATR